MKNMLPSYHNHTRWSDGSAPLEEFVASASAYAGEIGVSDHYVLCPYGPVEWSMPLDALGAYVEAVRRCAEERPGLSLRVGVEADFFPETVGDLECELGRHSFDFVIGAVHFVGRFPLDSRASDWVGLDAEQVDEIWRQYWRLVRGMADTGLFDIVAHLDLPKKFGYRPRADLTKEEASALDAIRDAGMAVEINTAGWALPAGEQYPSLRLLEAAAEREIPLVISADAHRPDYVTRFFDRAVDLARAAGYGGYCTFKDRTRCLVAFHSEE